MIPADAELKLFRGVWCAYFRADGTSKRVSLRTEDKAIARQRLEEAKKKSATTVGTIADAWKLYVKGRLGEVADQERPKFAWKKLEPFFGDLKEDQITRDLCKEYCERRKKDGVGAATIRRELTTLHAALNFVKKREDREFWLPPQPPPRDVWLRKEQARLLIDECAGTPHLKLFVLVALATAARKTAILQLKWSQVDFEHGQIDLAVAIRNVEQDDDDDDEYDGVSRKGRAIVPMTDSLREALLAAKEISTSNYVISWGGKPVGDIKKGFSSAVSALAKKKGRGWTKVTPHVLRHTAAVWMASAGVSMDMIATYLGHSDTEITRRIYAKFAPDHLRSAAKALEM